MSNRLRPRIGMVTQTPKAEEEDELWTIMRMPGAKVANNNYGRGNVEMTDASERD